MMDDQTKNLIEIVLTIITMAGAVVVFIVGWKQWKTSLLQWERSQAWQRSEQLDKFIERFETDELLRLAMSILDWSDRTVIFREKSLTIKNDEVLYALQDHSKIEGGAEFPNPQPTFRDAYDALLAFFQRLESAITTGLIDAAPARAYFSYWLKRLILLDQHHNKNAILKNMTPRELVAGYISAYGSPESIKKLCMDFGIEAPQFKKAH